jgi:hypothetical protein
MTETQLVTTKIFPSEEERRAGIYMACYGEVVVYSTSLENHLQTYRTNSSSTLAKVITAEVNVLRQRRAEFERVVPQIIRDNMSFIKSPNELDALVEQALVTIASANK